MVGIGSAAVIALLCLGAIMLVRAAPLPPERQASALSDVASDEPASARPFDTGSARTEAPTEDAEPSPKAPEPPVDVAVPEGDPPVGATRQPGDTTVQPSSPGAPALTVPTCPTGEVIVTRPTTAEVSLDPVAAESINNLGMSDLLDPEDRTTNRLTYSGGKVINNTTAPIQMSNAPNVVPTGVNDGHAWGAYDGSAEIPPGASVDWSAVGAGTFPRANVTGFALELRWVAPYWAAESDVSCPPPAFIER